VNAEREREREKREERSEEKRREEKRRKEKRRGEKRRERGSLSTSESASKSMGIAHMECSQMIDLLVAHNHWDSLISVPIFPTSVVAATA
jgi:hypothetical protein